MTKQEQFLTALEQWDFPESLDPQECLEAIQWDTDDEDLKCVQFDLAEALYTYCILWHGGQWSDLYKIQCQLGQIYKPSDCAALNGEEFETEVVAEFYRMFPEVQNRMENGI